MQARLAIIQGIELPAPPLPPSENGRGERARGWQAIEVNNSNSDVIIVDIGS